MAYVLLFVALLAWAAFAFRGQSLREYAPVYFVGALLAIAAEFTLSGVFRLYIYHSGWMADPFRDERLMAFFVSLGIDPLMVVLAVRYSNRHPVMGSLLSAGVVALLEVVFAWYGQMRYPVGWGPLLSFLVAAPSFWGMWALKAGRLPLPLWLHMQAMAFWCAMPLDALLNGALQLYYLVSPIAITGSVSLDSRIAAFLYNLIVRSTIATIVAVGPWRNRWPASAAGIATLSLLQLALLYSGVLVYRQWNFALGVLREAAVIIPTVLYARWYLQGGHKGIEPWVPPVRPRGRV